METKMAFGVYLQFMQRITVLTTRIHHINVNLVEIKTKSILFFDVQQINCGMSLKTQI